MFDSISFRLWLNFLWHSRAEEKHWGQKNSRKILCWWEHRTVFSDSVLFIKHNQWQPLGVAGGHTVAKPLLRTCGRESLPCGRSQWHVPPACSINLEAWTPPSAHSHVPYLAQVSSSDTIQFYLIREWKTTWKIIGLVFSSLREWRYVSLGYSTWRVFFLSFLKRSEDPCLRQLSYSLSNLWMPFFFNYLFKFLLWIHYSGFYFCNL